jgi:hypothetical protein
VVWFTVQLEDKPGALARMADALAKKGINITSIVGIAEDTDGADAVDQRPAGTGRPQALSSNAWSTPRTRALLDEMSKATGLRERRDGQHEPTAPQSPSASTSSTPQVVADSARLQAGGTVELQHCPPLGGRWLAGGDRTGGRKLPRTR